MAFHGAGVVDEDKIIMRFLKWLQQYITRGREEGTIAADFDEWTEADLEAVIKEYLEPGLHEKD